MKYFLNSSVKLVSGEGAKRSIKLFSSLYTSLQVIVPSILATLKTQNERRELKNVPFKFWVPAGDCNSSPPVPASITVIPWKRHHTSGKISQLEVQWVAQVAI